MGDLRTFAKDYNLHVNRAIRRYEKGVPETMESLSSKGQDGAALITVTQSILEFKDAIFMNLTDVDWVRIHVERTVHMVLVTHPVSLG